MTSPWGCSRRWSSSRLLNDVLSMLIIGRGVIMSIRFEREGGKEGGWVYIGMEARDGW